MNRLIEKKVDVFLKIDKEILSGILLDVEEEYVYIQSSENLIAIPKENIKYYVSKSEHIRTQQDESLCEPTESYLSSLYVYVDKQMITKIPVPPTFDLSSYSDTIMKIILGNPDVRAALTGRVQRSMEYFPGKIYIETDKGGDISEPESAASPISTVSNNSFVMGGAGNSMVSDYLQPSQMVGKLSQAVTRLKSGEKKDE